MYVHVRKYIHRYIDTYICTYLRIYDLCIHVRSYVHSKLHRYMDANSSYNLYEYVPCPSTVLCLSCGAILVTILMSKNMHCDFVCLRIEWVLFEGIEDK